MKILIAVDGGKGAATAVKKAIELAQAFAKPPSLTLIHADIPLMRRVAAELGLEGSRRYHEANHEHALKSARTALRRAKLAFSERTVVDDAAPAILKAAKSGKFDLVVMGSHGRGTVGQLLLGSVAQKVIAEGIVPVLVVR